MIKIVTDTGACLPHDILQQHKIMLVPGHVSFGEETYLDHYEMPNPEFYHRLGSTKEIPTFFDPTPEQFRTLYGKIRSAFPDDTILSIHMSDGVTGIVKAANEAAASFTSLDIHIFDTQSVGVGQGLMVLEAAQMVESLNSAGTILNHLNAMRNGMQQYLMLESLDYLARAGRIGSMGHLFSKLLDIKPVLTLQKGQFIPFRQHRTRAQALEALSGLILKLERGTRKLRVGIMHAGCEAEAQQLATDLQNQLTPEVFVFAEMGAGVASLMGPGTLGVSWWAPRKIG
ncbi:MAG: DegV family protein [Anaerolineae bacterium]|nr:DegV family protein [Anaerolineae bacterium]